jgi:rhodanese-related sulfurtransferase
MNKRAFKDEVYSLIVQLVKAMGNAHRLEIIDLLSQGEFSVEQIADEVHLSIANTSQHLQTLKKTQLVKTRREGNFIFYTLFNLQVFHAWMALRDLAYENIDEVTRTIDRGHKKTNGLRVITLQELLPKLQKREVILLDVRPAAEFSTGHLPEAINIPISELIVKMPFLDKLADYVAYCRGPLCVFADQAVELLNKNGYKAIRMLEGFPDYLLSGLQFKKAS